MYKQIVTREQREILRFYPVTVTSEILMLHNFIPHLLFYCSKIVCQRDILFKQKMFHSCDALKKKQSFVKCYLLLCNACIF